MSSLSDAQLLQSLLVSPSSPTDDTDSAAAQQQHHQTRRRQSTRREEEPRPQQPRATAPRSREWCIFVKQLTGRTAQFQVIPSETVLTLKRKILDKLGIPIDQCRLLFNSKQLSDESTLEATGIADEAVVFLVARVAGISRLPSEDAPSRATIASEPEDASDAFPSVECSSSSSSSFFESSSSSSSTFTNPASSDVVWSLYAKLKGRTAELRVSPDDTLGDLVDIIRDEFGIPDHLDIRLQRQSSPPGPKTGKVSRRRPIFSNIEMNLDATLCECELGQEEVLNVVQEARRRQQRPTVQVTSQAAGTSSFDRLRFILSTLWAHLCLWLASKPLLVACYRRMVSVFDALIVCFRSSVLPFLHRNGHRFYEHFIRPIAHRCSNALQTLRLHFITRIRQPLASLWARIHLVFTNLHQRVHQAVADHWVLYISPRIERAIDGLRTYVARAQLTARADRLRQMIATTMDGFSRLRIRATTFVRENIGPHYVRFCIAFYNQCNALQLQLASLLRRVVAWISPKLTAARLSLCEWLHNRVVLPIANLYSSLRARIRAVVRAFFNACREPLNRLFDFLEFRILNPLGRASSHCHQLLRSLFRRLVLLNRQYCLPLLNVVLNPLRQLKHRFVAWLTWAQGPISNCGVRVSVLPAVRLNIPCHPQIHAVFGLQDQQDYAIVLQNTTSGWLYAHVSIDGQLIGLLNISPLQVFNLERFIDAHSRFRFIANRSVPAATASTQTMPTEGIIEVNFRLYQNEQSTPVPARSRRRAAWLADNNTNIAQENDDNTENDAAACNEAEEPNEERFSIISGRTERGAQSNQFLQSGVISEGNLSEVIETMRIQLILQQ